MGGGRVEVRFWRGERRRKSEWGRVERMRMPGGTPPRVFCAKSAGIVENRGVSNLTDAKECVRV